MTDHKDHDHKADCCSPGLDPGFVCGCHSHEEENEHRLDLKILACLLGGTTLLASGVARLLFETPQQSELLAMLATIVMGTPIMVDAVRSVRSRSSHMEELVAIALAAAFASGQYLEAGAIAFFMLISSFIEHRTAVGARKSIESLIRITPTRASKKTDQGEVEVDASQLRPKDVVVVRPGDNIPGDGVIQKGQSAIDQANITGESLPVEKGEGDEVFSGTINQTGVLEVEITRAGKDSTLGRVQDLILQAAGSRPSVIRMIDQYIGWYTPVILMIALIVFFLTHDINKSISLLLVACPCAIVLSAPTAMIAALSASARVGVLIKNVADLEVARQISTIVLDKTGTLTLGKLAVTRLFPAKGVDGAELLQICASAEKDSKHPVARAVVDMATKAKLTFLETANTEEIAGRGVRSTVGGHKVLVGREMWIAEQGVDLSDLDTSQAEGMSLLYVARDGKVLGWIGLEDTIRPGAVKAMDELEELHVKRRVMITGDRRSAAHRVARTIHCTDVHAEALPADKLDLVEQLKGSRHVVAVVGDGVNDGPALAAGNISIAMGAAGSDVAINSASIALMNNNLNRIPFLVRLSRKTTAVVRENLIGVVLYILIMVVLIAYGMITPMMVAIAHGVSSIAVCFNSARLVREGEYLTDDVGDAESKVHQRHVDVEAVRPAQA